MAFDIQEQVKKKVRQLPALPIAVSQTLALIDRGDVDMGTLGQVIGKDPALVAQVLRVANSPFYGLPRQIGSIKEACMVMGLPTVRNLTVSAGLANRFFVEHGTLDRAALWRHALHTALTTDALTHSDRQCSGLGFIAGLLHDVGTLVLDTYFPDELAEAVRYGADTRLSAWEAERIVLKVDHAEVGAWVLANWKLPQVLVQTIRKHHLPDDEPIAPLTDAVHIADALVHSLNAGEDVAGLLRRLSPGATRRIGYSAAQWRACMDKVAPLHNAADSWGGN